MCPVAAAVQEMMKEGLGAGGGGTTTGPKVLTLQQIIENIVKRQDKFSKDKFANLQIDWMGKRKIAYVISGVFIVAGLASIFTRGFDLGVDFKGGYAYNVQFAEGSNVDTEAIKQGLTEILGSTPEVKAVDSDNTLRILTSYLIEENGCIHVIASIEAIFYEEELLSPDNWLQLDKGKVVAINGLDGYALPQLLERFSYARPKK